jgi:hypothetical protein
MAMIVVALAASVTDGAAQSRMTFSNGHFLLNGTPAFLLGVYDSGFLNVPAEGWEKALFAGTGDVKYYRGLKDMPINAYLNYFQGMRTADEIWDLLNVLGSHGVMWWQTTNCSGDGSYTRYTPPGFTVDREPKGDFARYVAGHPFMAGYYVMDECGDAGYGTNLVPETQEHHATLKGYDPAAVNFAVPIARGYRDPLYWLTPPYKDTSSQNTAPTADLFGTDPYPMYGSEGRTGYPQFEVADYIARLRDDVSSRLSPSIPVVGVLQFFKFGGGGRLPTRAEMRMHAYSAIVEGAQGLFWWDIGENGVRSRSVKSNELTTALQNLKDLVNEIHGLEAALLAPPAPGALVVTGGPAFSTALAWRIDAVSKNIPLISNYADKQWYQAELSALQQGNDSLSPMVHQAAPQKSYIRTRTALVSEVGNPAPVGYVIAYNYGKTAIKGVTFTWQSAPTRVDVVGEGRTLLPTGSTFKDDFGPYEAHVYRIVQP